MLFLTQSVNKSCITPYMLNSNHTYGVSCLVALLHVSCLKQLMPHMILYQKSPLFLDWTKSKKISEVKYNMPDFLNTYRAGLRYIRTLISA